MKLSHLELSTDPSRKKSLKHNAAGKTGCQYFDEAGGIPGGRPGRAAGGGRRADRNCGRGDGAVCAGARSRAGGREVGARTGQRETRGLRAVEGRRRHDLARGEHAAAGIFSRGRDTLAGAPEARREAAGSAGIPRAAGGLHRAAVDSQRRGERRHPAHLPRLGGGADAGRPGRGESVDRAARPAGLPRRRRARAGGARLRQWPSADRPALVRLPLGLSAG